MVIEKLEGEAQVEICSVIKGVGTIAAERDQLWISNTLRIKEINAMSRC